MAESTVIEELREIVQEWSGLTLHPEVFATLVEGEGLVAEAERWGAGDTVVREEAMDLTMKKLIVRGGRSIGTASRRLSSTPSWRRLRRPTTASSRATHERQEQEQSLHRSAQPERLLRSSEGEASDRGARCSRHGEEPTR